MIPAVDKEKQSLLAQIRSLLAHRISARKFKLAEKFIHFYFRRVPMDDLGRVSPSILATIVERQLEFISHRPRGQSLIRVFNPGMQEDGWESAHTIIEMVHDDMPFLVDTATLALSEMKLNVHLIIHPVMYIGRDDKGDLRAIYWKKRELGHPESIMQIQVDRQNDPHELARIEERLKAALNDATLAVKDWKAMLKQVKQTAREMPVWAPHVKPELLRECQDFMSWLTQDNFIFLGSRDYAVVKGKKSYELEQVPDSGMGILRNVDQNLRSRPLSSLGEAARKRTQPIPLIITKTNARSTVHRVGYLDYIGVLQFDKRGRTIGERRFLGLFTSKVYHAGVTDIPLVRVRTQHVLDDAMLTEGSHAWKSMMHILETLPRDDLFQANSNELQEIAVGVLNLQERQRVRLFIRRERYGRFWSCLVYIPRERFNTENREHIQGILYKALKGQRLDYAVHVSESRLARLQVIVRSKPGSEIRPDVLLLEHKIVEAVRSWRDELRSTLIQKHGEDAGLKFFTRFGKAFPEAYKEDVSPWVAAFDVANAAAVDNGEPLRMSLYRPRKKSGGLIRFKLFRKHKPIPLSDVLPMLENLGLHIVSERPYELRLPDELSFWIQDFDMLPGVGRELELDVIRDLFQESFEKTLNGYTDSDGFNRLIIAAQMHWRQVKVMRAYCKYLLQTGIPFSLNYMAETLAKYPPIARMLVEMFEASFDPVRDRESKHRKAKESKKLARRFETLLSGEFARDTVLLEFVGDMVAARENGREEQVNAIRKAYKRALESVSSLDEDRILHAYYRVIRATLRTSYYQHDESDGQRDYVSFKLNSEQVPDLPLPRPFREIWVYSPRFEGIHLRRGMIARGGLRWSDRREDFRTEVLGLMKAQNVKNTMIVPVGAKGGFVVKYLPNQGTRDEVMKEVINCYSKFINGLLDITDNLDEQTIIPPVNVVRHDGDDPYLVVAADKGTSTFSDTANAIAQEHGFWLGDAFASGGSVGYDHKAMGITAKGAWEGVKRHFREIGKNIQAEPFTVVGIGDMGGDVFGNGMLLSKQIRLQAAFNHQHIFLDPDPDPAVSFKERRRLFRKKRSSWADYKAGLISRGGGVFSRYDKTIPISTQVRTWLGIEAERLTPHELIRELIKAPVDLLWNGGIGTYVKASQESHADAGDLSNNFLRVNGNQLRCKVVGEGGNLGLTQKGRIEYAQCGGRINTDFIDNSAGVDTSDHEVNIKILLNQVMRAGDIDTEERNTLLASMKNEVSSLVLRSNYLQTQAISMMEQLKGPRLGAKQHFISVLESEGILDRNLEHLPDDEDLTERRNRGEGLTRPELSVILSYSKITLYQQLLASDVPEDTYLSSELLRYFPQPLRELYSGIMPEHRLKREIIATQVTNSMINRMGASFALRMRDDTGAIPAEVAKAFTIAREVFAARNFWEKIEALDDKVSTKLQITAILCMWNLLRQATRWLLNLPGRQLDIQQMIDRLAGGLLALEPIMRKSMTEQEAAQLKKSMEPYVEGGFPRALAARTALLEHLFPALDVVETAAQKDTDVDIVARVHFGLGKNLGLKWLRNHVEELPVQGQWHAQARSNLRDELSNHHNHLVERVLQAGGREADPVAAWSGRNEDELRQFMSMMQDMENLTKMDYATVAVAVRSLGQLVACTG